MQMEADFAKRQAYENLNDPAQQLITSWKSTRNLAFHLLRQYNQDFKSSRIQGFHFLIISLKWHRVFRRVLHTSNTKKLRKGSFQIFKRYSYKLKYPKGQIYETSATNSACSNARRYYKSKLSLADSERPRKTSKTSWNTTKGKWE